MKSCVKKNTLNNYLQKLKNISKIEFGETVANVIVQKGVEYAQKEYSGSKHTKIEGEVKDTKGTITASRKGIAYIEYGTGLVGKGTYPQENLPKSGVPITGNWEYFYLPSKSKNVEEGTWTFGGTTTRGRVAGMQMYRTAKSLENYIKQGELVEDLRKEIRK